MRRLLPFNSARGISMSSFPLNVLRLALKSNNNHGSHPVPDDFFTPPLA